MAQYDPIAHLERTCDEQAEMVRNMCQALRMVYADLRHDESYSHLKATIESAYPGGKKSLRLAIKGMGKQS